jgi:hypothetical protein
MRLLVPSLAAVAVAALLSAPPAVAETPHGNFELRIQGRYDFHTWIWALAGCNSGGEGDCVFVQSIPQPVARAYPYSGDAQLTDGRYTLAVDVPDGLRCGNVYYGTTIPTHDVYSWDAVTRVGVLTSSFGAGCDGRPGTLTYPFTLSLM